MLNFNLSRIGSSYMISYIFHLNNLPVLYIFYLHAQINNYIRYLCYSTIQISSSYDYTSTTTVSYLPHVTIYHMLNLDQIFYAHQIAFQYVTKGASRLPFLSPVAQKQPWYLLFTCPFHTLFLLSVEIQISKILRGKMLSKLYCLSSLTEAASHNNSKM